MSTSEWPTIDPSSDEDHSDLFTGDLFGDELLDMNMYNSPSVPDIQDEVQAPKAASMDYDGGLGALTHSSSIIDFTSILEDNNTVLTSPTKENPREQEPNPVHSSGIKLEQEVSDPSKKRARSIESQTALVDETTILPPTAKRVSPNKVPDMPDTSPTVQHVIHMKTETKIETEKDVHTNGMDIRQMIQENPVPVQADTVQSTLLHPAALPVIKNSVPVAPVVVKTSPALISPPQPVVQTAIKENHIIANASKVVSSLQVNDMCSVSDLASIKTEESFKGVAQAAVTNLILSAGNNVQGPKEVTDPAFVKPVDTSTAHVAALTSNNWVAACAASISGAPPGTAQAAQAAALAAASDPITAKAARARRATLTADERARQNRDRNREHARNTRLRKKAYVEELKRTLTELVTQRDAADVEKRHEKQRDLEVREVRYRVMEEFLKLRARGSEHNLLARWIAILEDGFTLTLPKTDYRGMVHNDDTPLRRRVSSEDATNTVPTQSNDNTIQILLNANQCFDDASKVASFMSSSVFMGNQVIMAYHCERSNFMMDGVKAMLDWTLKVSSHTQGTQCLYLKGSMRATFSPASNKLASAELIFDTGNVQKQIKILKTQQTPCPIEETGALLDSILPQVPTISPTTNPTIVMPSTVSVVSADKDLSSDEESTVIKAMPQAQTN